MSKQSLVAKGTVSSTTKKLEFQVFSQLPWPGWITNPQGQVININETALQLMQQLNIKLADNGKKPFPVQELLKHFDISSLAERKTLQSHWEGEWFYRQQKNLRTFKVSVFPIHSKEKGEIIGISYQLQDGTKESSKDQELSSLHKQLQNTQADLEQMFGELRRVYKLGNELLDGLTKELIMPVNKLVSRIRGLHDVRDSMSTLQQQHVAEIQQQIELLRTIVSSIDHLVELQQDLQETAPEKIDVRAMVKDAFAENIFWQRKKGLVLNTKFPGQLVIVKSPGANLKKLLNLLVREVHLACKANSQIKVSCHQDKIHDMVQLHILYQGTRLDKFAESASGQESQKRFAIWLPLLQRNMLQNGGNLEFGENKHGVYLEINMVQDHTKTERTRVLICDENKNDSRLVKKLLFKHWPRALILDFTNPFDLLDRHDNFQPDLVVIDPNFSQPGWGQHRALASLFQQRQHICPVLSISTLYNKEAECVLVAKRGVSDYIAKPCSEFDLDFKLKRMLTLHRRERNLQQTMGITQRQAYTDFLTGLGNRNHFDDFLKVQISYSKQTNKKCTLVMMDVDHFKHFNDIHGHQLGDELLRSIGQLLQKSVRSSDLAARYGGEEFVLVLPETDKIMGAAIAEKVRISIESINIPEAKQQPLGLISASFGVACFDVDGKDPASLIHWADQCMYAAKEAGRNKVITSLKPS